MAFRLVGLVLIVNGAIWFQNGQVVQVNAQQTPPFTPENGPRGFTSAFTTTTSPASSSNNTLSLGIVVMDVGSQVAVDATVTLTLRGSNAWWQASTTNGEAWFRNLRVGMYTIQLSGISDGCQTSAASELNFTYSTLVIIPVSCS